MEGKLKEYLADNLDFITYDAGTGNDPCFLHWTCTYADELDCDLEMKELMIDGIVQVIDSIYSEWFLVSEYPLTEQTDCIFYSEDLRNPCNMAMGIYFPNQGFKSAGILWKNVTHYKFSPEKPEK